MHLILILVLLAAMCWPLWIALSEARDNLGPHNSSTLELALIGLGTLAIYWLAKQLGLARSGRPSRDSSAPVAILYAEANPTQNADEAADHAA